MADADITADADDGEILEIFFATKRRLFNDDASFHAGYDVQENSHNDVFKG